MDVIVGAGGVAKEGDPLLGLVPEGQPKALLDIAGRPMVQWVLDAVAGSDRIENVVIVGLGDEHGVRCEGKAVHFLPDAGSLLDNATAGSRLVAEVSPASRHVVWVSADIPLLTTEMLDWLIDEVERSDHDLYYAIIEKSLMEGRFPESKRSYTRLKSGPVCGGDVNAFALALASDTNQFWRQIVEARKSMLKVTSIVGLWPLLILASGQMTKARAVELARERLGVDGRLVDCPYAELGMDVDKPFQYEIVLRELGQRTQPA